MLGVKRLSIVVKGEGMVDEGFSKNGSFTTTWRTSKDKVAAIASLKKIIKRIEDKLAIDKGLTGYFNELLKASRIANLSNRR